MFRTKSNQGFTLIELLTACAIVSMLVAISIPQFLKFRLKALRAEAIIVANGAYKAQNAYLASVDHYMNACPPPMGSMCQASNVQIMTLGDNLGLPIITDASGTPITPHGYAYHWYVSGSNVPNYELMLLGHIDLTTIYQDAIYTSVEGYYQVLDETFLQCTSKCGWVNGLPFLYEDGITRRYNCPC